MINFFKESGTFVDDIKNTNNYVSILTAKRCQTPLRTNIDTVKMRHSTHTEQRPTWTSENNNHTNAAYNVIFTDDNTETQVFLSGRSWGTSQLTRARYSIQWLHLHI